jgi:DNA polymerase-1
MNQLLPRLYDIQRVYSGIKLHGIRLDIPYVEQKIAELEDEVIKETLVMQGIVGSSFNPNSPDQVARYLFGELGYPVHHLTDTGKPSTDVDALHFLQETVQDDPFLNSLLRQRKVNKFNGTYFKGFYERADRNGYIHPNLNVYGTVTGRPSSSNPNILNIPTRGKEAKQVKQMILPDEGHVLLQVDISQAELRLIAHYSQDPELRRVYREGIDLHHLTAVWAWGELRAAEMRRLAKNCNFNMGYMGGPETICELIWNNYSSEERDSLIAEAGNKDRAYADLLSEVIQFYVNWINRFNRVPVWWKEHCEQAFTLGYVETVFGRRRRIPLIPDSERDPGGYEDLKRHLVNFPIQSTSVDIAQEAMIRMAHRIEIDRLNARVINCVYDSIWYSTHPDHVEFLSEETVRQMESIPVEYGIDSVPFEAEVEWGHNASESFSLADWSSSAA